MNALASASALAGLAAAAASAGLMSLPIPAPSRRPRPGTHAGIALASLGGLRRLLPGFVRLAARRDTAGDIARAGLAGQLQPRDVASARVACAIAAALLLPRLAGLLPLRMLPVGIPLLLAAAAQVPLLWLRLRARRRASALRAALPDMLDLLRACIAAGLSLRRALTMVSGQCAEPLAAELRAVTAETSFGVPQASALEAFAARNPQREVCSLVAAIAQAERHGTPLAPVIAAQGDDARAALNREILERGARAGPKIQLIVSATIVPAALLAMGAVVIAAIARGDLAMF